MNLISAFADEIDDDPDIQIRELARNGVGNIELRGAWGRNVLALRAGEVRDIKRRAGGPRDRLLRVGSPLGKFPLTGDFQEQLDGMRRALEYAEILQAPYIRVFSFYPPEGESAAAHRTQVLDWLARLVEVAAATPTRLAHENERNIYGETGDRVLDLLTSIHSPSLVCAFDFSNFVQCGQRPYRDCWGKLKPYLGYFHVKDALPDGTVVPAGQGAGDLKRIPDRGVRGRLPRLPDSGTAPEAGAGPPAPIQGGPVRRCRAGAARTAGGPTRQRCRHRGAFGLPLTGPPQAPGAGSRASLLQLLVEQVLVRRHRHPVVEPRGQVHGVGDRQPADPLLARSQQTGAVRDGFPRSCA